MNTHNHHTTNHHLSHDLDLLTAVHPKGPLKAMMRRKYIVYFRDVSSYINSKWFGAKIQMWYFVYYYINLLDFCQTYDCVNDLGFLNFRANIYLSSLTHP